MISTISDLDVGSLQRILSYLPYVDKLKMLLVTKCVVKFAEEIFDTEPFDILHVQIHFSVEELKQLLIDCGRYVKRLRYPGWLSDETTLAYAKLLPQHCSNLQEIHFSELEITITNIYGQILSSAQKTIKKLTLEECTVREPSCSLIANMSQLKVLNLPRSELSGKDFGRLKNLTELNMRECKNFLGENFIEILKSNKLVKLNLGQFSTSGNVEDIILKTQPNLKMLTVSNSRPQICGMKTLRELSMDIWFERYVVEYLKELVTNRVLIESLEITKSLKSSKISDTNKSEIINQIIQLNNLRTLSFHNIECMGNPELVQVAKFCRNIEMLDLCGTSISDDGIIGCLEYLKELRYLDVSYCNVEKSLYRRLVEIRNELGFLQKLIVYIRPQKKLEAVLKSDVYADTMEFVQLTQSPMRTLGDSSMLERLEQLNMAYSNDNLKLVRLAPRSAKSLSSQTPALLALDDNSLYHIMKYLPLVDQLKLTVCNSRFENIIKYFFCTNPLEFVKFVKSFEIREAETLLTRWGHMMKKLHIRNRSFFFHFEYYDFVAKYFTNVVELHVENVNLYEKVISNSQNSLEALHIKNCEIGEKVAMQISKAAKLHTLFLDGSSLTGAHLDDLKNLTSLDLSYVKHLKPASFIAICKSNRLKDLHIKGCKTLNNQSFLVLAATQTDLEILAIGGKYAATNICLVAWLKKLKDLKFEHLSPKELLQCIYALDKLKCDQLEFLDFYKSQQVDAMDWLMISRYVAVLRNLKYLRVDHCKGINHGFISTIAKGCPSLKALDVSRSCIWNEEILLEAIRLFKCLQHFDVHGCNIRENLLYRGALEIMKEANRGLLVLYTDVNCDFILEIEKTREYIINRKYVKLSSECLWKLNKYKLVKEETQQCQDKAEPRQSHRKEVAPSQPSIIDMPVCCLQRIASYLQPIDKLVFAYLHKTILTSIKTTLDNLPHSLNDIARTFTMSEARDLFAACAGHIKRIQFSTIGSTVFTDYIKILQPYRSYLIEIDMTWQDNMQPSKAGTQEDPKGRIKKWASIDGILEVLTKTLGVVSLRLDISDSGSSEKYADALDSLIACLRNYIMDYSKIDNEYFQKICHNCKLKQLNITGVSSLNESSFTVLAKTQNDHLQHLSMSCTSETCNYTEVAKIGSLRHITIVVDTQLSKFKNFLKMLVRYRRYDLEYLKIISAVQQNDLGISIYDMVEKVKNYFRNLKEITIDESSLPTFGEY